MTYSATTPQLQPDWRTAWLAATPVLLCMLVMAVPAWHNGPALLYRGLYLLCFLAWLPALVLLQRRLWRSTLPAVGVWAVLLVATYLMSLANNALGATITQWRGALPEDWRWYRLLGGLDDCWLALLAYCATHALAMHALALRDARERQQAATLLAREAELRALRYQLNPHFLFNALNAVSALVATGRGDDARAMLAQLGTLFRAMLDTHDHEVALADELALTQSYLEIEALRLGDRLRVDWRIGAGVLDARVPCLLLQPLVENAVRHGIAPGEGAGTLLVSVQRAGDSLHMQVRNSIGPNVRDAARTRCAVGQPNVASRLAHLYPQAHTLHAGLTDDGHYSVDIALPFSSFHASAAPVGEAHEATA